MMKDKKKKSSYVKMVAMIILFAEIAMFAYSVFLMIKADLMQNVYNVVSGVMLAVAMLFIDFASASGIVIPCRIW